MNDSLAERTYIVTGGAGGIGGGLAEAITEAGGRVVLADLELTSASEVADRVDATGDSVAAVACNVTSSDDAERAVSFTLDRFGRLDGLVNNAGVITMDDAWSATADDWNRQLSINVTGSFVMAQAVGEHLRTVGGGAIVNIASNAGKVGYRNMAAYNASKAAVISLTRSLAMEWAENQINVNAVCPGGVDTPMLSGVADWLAPRLELGADEILAGMGAAQLGRKIAPVEVGRVVAFLLSDAAVIIRGQAVSIDGGDTPY